MHPCHHKQIPKLNRVAGQIEGVKRMIDGGEYCVDIITQLKAVRQALKTIELSVLETHLNNCLIDAAQKSDDARNERVAEIIKLLKKYE